MKKIILMAVSAVLLAAGCQKTTIENPAPEPSMVFATGMNKLTKASDLKADADSSGTDNLKAQDFRVWAYTNYEDALNSITKGAVYDGMANLNVYYHLVNNTSDSWTTNKQYYWPGTKKNLLFFAVSGADYGEDLSPTEKVVPNASQKTINIPAFAVDTLAPNRDLMVADIVDQHQADKEVNLNFRHTLAKVQFEFKTVTDSSMRVLVQDIEVKDLVATGDLTVSVADTSYVKTEDANNPSDTTSTIYPVEFTWKATEGAKTATFIDDYVEEYTDWKWGTGNIELADGKTIVKDPANDTGFNRQAMLLKNEAQEFATWLMVPQEITGKKVTVTYIINNRQFKTVFSLDHTSLIPANDTKAKWLQNQYIKYTVTLTPNVISFSPDVTPWDEVDNVNMNN